jgi:membrane-bound lytic murein transglycosylase D
VRVPEGKSEIIQRNLAAGAELPSVNLSVRHRVRRGETLRSIAESYSVSAVELARVNGLGRGRPLRRGQMLTVPSSMRAPQPEVLAADSDDPRASTDYVPARRIGLPGKIDGNSVPIDRVTHTVKRGETLSSIAGKYGVSSSDLRQWNRLQVGTVRVGTRLRIRSSADAPGPATANGGKSSAPAASTAAAPAPPRPRPRLHTVARGESLAAIAGKYDVTITELRHWNDLGKDDTLEAGRVLEVSENAVADASTLDAPAGVKKSSPSANATNAANAKSKAGRTHTVRTGETITEIAGRYDVSVESLRKTNKLRTTKLLVGQKLKLPRSTRSATRTGRSSREDRPEAFPTEVVLAASGRRWVVRRAGRCWVLPWGRVDARNRSLLAPPPLLFYSLMAIGIAHGRAVGVS